MPTESQLNILLESDFEFSHPHLNFDTMISDKIISIAKSYIGEQEILGNKGFKDPAFQKLMVSAGWLYGQSWCLYYAKAVWLLAYEGTALKGKVDAVLNGSALGSYYNAAHDGTFPVGKIPKPGAIAIFKHGIDPAHHEGHGAIDIDNAPAITCFNSIDANTTSDANPDIREGWTVAYKQHGLYLPPNPNGLNLVGFIYPVEP